MADFFLCCFRSCLRGKDTNSTEYYELLGLPTSATNDDIKRAYKRKSLEMHPDKLAQRGITVTEEDLARFQKMKDAYDVLSDPNKRRYYDEFGESGVKIIDNTQSMNFVDLLRNFQDNKVDCALITLLIIAVFVFVLSLPILIALKADGTISLPWYLIWIPMWIVDLILLIYSSLNLCCCAFDSNDAENDMNSPLTTKLYYFAQIFLFVSLQITVIMKADNILSDQWIFVFVPYFVSEVLTISAFLPTALVDVPKPDYRDIAAMVEDPFEQQFARIQVDEEHYANTLSRYYAVRQVLVSCVFIVFAVLLSMKLDGDDSLQWFAVFLPIVLYFVGQIIFGSFLSALGTKAMKRLGISGEEQKLDPVQEAEMKRAASLILLGNGTMCNIFLPLSLVVLLMLYLSVGGFSAFIVMIPIFLVVGCFMCCTFCGLYFLSSVDVDKLQETQGQGSYRRQQQTSSPSSSSSSAAANTTGSRASSETDGLLGKNTATSYGMTQDLHNKPPAEMSLRVNSSLEVTMSNFAKADLKYFFFLFSRNYDQRFKKRVFLLKLWVCRKSTNLFHYWKITGSAQVDKAFRGKQVAVVLVVAARRTDLGLTVLIEWGHMKISDFISLLPQKQEECSV